MTNRRSRGGSTRATTSHASGMPSAVRAVTSTTPSHRIASIVASPTRGPASTVTPASPFDGCRLGRVHKHGQQRCRVSIDGAVTAVEGVEADCPQRIRIPSCPRHRARVLSGSVSAFASRASTTIRPATPGRRPLRRHADSSMFGWTMRYRSLNAIPHRPGSYGVVSPPGCGSPRCRSPPCRSAGRRLSSLPANLPTATARSNPISPAATASSTSGRSSRRWAVTTRSRAVSGATSSRPRPIRPIDRHPSAVDI